MTTPVRARGRSRTGRPSRRGPGLLALVGIAGLVLAGFLTAPSAHAASAAAPYDFNGDGYADLAVGVPGEGLGSVTGAGAVQVLYGGRGGLSARGSQFWSQSSTGVKGRAARGDGFGQELASADFDRDGYADLAVGIPGAGLVRGSVAVLYGARNGLSARDQLLYSGDAGYSGGWGHSLATGDFDGDGRADLAVSGNHTEAPGAVLVLRGTSSGLTRAGASRLTKDSPGVEGDSVPGDHFGMQLAAGDVNGDGRDDLVAATMQSPSGGDGVYYLPGSPTGITGVGSQFFDAATPGLAPPGTALSRLGSVLELADFQGDGHADLVVTDHDAGPPGDTDCWERAQCPGVVLVLRGTSTGFDLTEGKQLWYGGARNLPSSPVPSYRFGSALATGDLNRDGRLDLAIGVAGARVGDQYGAGAVNVLYGSAEGLGAQGAQGAQLWTQDSRGIKSVAREGDGFGVALTIADFGNGTGGDLAASAQNANSTQGWSSGGVNVLYGSRAGVTTTDDYWTQDSPGIAGSTEQDDYFAVLGG